MTNGYSVYIWRIYQQILQVDTNSVIVVGIVIDMTMAFPFGISWMIASMS
jgi:hypothetical protein